MRARISLVGLLIPHSTSDDTRLATSIRDINHAGIEALPTGAGVYRFLDEAGLPLYIGKSVNIRPRVQAHMRMPQERTLLGRIRRIDFFRTAGGTGALLLKSQLIKQWQPPCNVLLKFAALPTCYTCLKVVSGHKW